VGVELTAPAAVLAIDGGNSKTDVALIGPDGGLLAEVHGAGTSMEASRFAKSIAVLDKLVATVATAAGIDPAGPIAEHVSAFHAGLDLPDEEARLAAALAQRGWSRDHRIGNDTFAVLRAGSSRTWGVGVTCGAGINCVGVAPDGTDTRFLALGRLSGDWGGGMDVAREVLWWSIRAEDGRGEPTALHAATTGHYGLASMHDVCVAIHLGELDQARVNELTYVLFDVVETGDAVAGRLVDRLAAEVSLMALVAMRRLALTGLDTEVVLGGGLLAAGHARLDRGIEAAILAEAPAARLRVLAAPPVVGAALLGLDHIGSGQPAHRALRRAMAGAGRF
jgi:N-acetylglucosamine kinase-like BadF-type ATPase